MACGKPRSYMKGIVTNKIVMTEIVTNKYNMTVIVTIKIAK